MPAQASVEPRRHGRDPGWWHLPLLLSGSIAYESLFLHHGIAWLFDEGWPLYAAMRLHEGGALYRDTFFAFPPGHLLAAWVAYAIDPPGVIVARLVYAAFNVALCAALYVLGRRLMPAPFALLAAALLAVASPRGHLAHYLFGYRYLVFSVLTLLLFGRRLRTGNPLWMLPAGVCAGIALCFRLTPAFAVSCAVAIAAASADRNWRSWLRDGGWYGAGLLAAIAPFVVWFAIDPGVDVIWREVITRVVGLQSAQSLPVPELALPAQWDRQQILRWFVAVQYRLYAALYVAYAATLLTLWIRSLRRRAPFPHALLLAVVVWGGLYFLRTLGRSDESHLVSAIPPVCLLLAHALSKGLAAVPRLADPTTRGRAETAIVVVALGAWIFLLGSDLYLDPARRGRHPLHALNGSVAISSRSKALDIDRVVTALRQSTRPGEHVLNLSPSPLFHVLAERSGPGYFDVLMPGTFLDEGEERELLAHLEQSPPAAVIWPEHPFDGMPSRSIRRTAPHLARWVEERYEGRGPRRRWMLMFPRNRLSHPKTADPGLDPRSAEKEDVTFRGANPRQRTAKLLHEHFGAHTRADEVTR